MNQLLSAHSGDQSLYEAILTSSAAFSGIILAFLAILFGIYSIYVVPTPDRLERLPIIQTVRTIAWIVFGVLVYNSLVIALSVLGLLRNPTWLSPTLVTLFLIEVGAIPPFVLMFIRRVMR